MDAMSGLSGGRRVRFGKGATRWSFVVVGVPAVALLVGFVGLLLYCRGLLQSAAEGRDVVFGESAAWLSIGGFLVASLVVFLVQVVRLTHLVEGPEHRLQQSLRRIRAGDLSFRVSLRRGDLLQGLAQECNEVLEWLNRCPPVGARTGGDVVAVAEQVEEGEP